MLLREDVLSWAACADTGGHGNIWAQAAVQVHVYVDDPMAVGSMSMFHDAHDSSKCRNDVPGLDCRLRHCAELALALTWAAH